MLYTLSKYLLIFFIIPLNAQSTVNDTLVFNTQEFPPFHYSENNTIAGPVTKIIYLICKELSIPCKVKSLPWPRAQEEVYTEVADALFVIGKNKDREKWLHFSRPLLKTEYGFFTHKNHDFKINSMQNVHGKTIGVYGPSNTHSTLLSIKDNVPSMKIDLRYDSVSGFKKLNRARVDAVFSNKSVGEYLVHELQLHNVVYNSDYKEIYYYVGFNKKLVSVGFVKAFNAVIDSPAFSSKLYSVLKKHKLESAFVGNRRSRVSQSSLNR
ncbi:MAG: transporter substrate-binding domain-containing protein [Fibrobacterales bacterium]